MRIRLVLSAFIATIVTGFFVACGPVGGVGSCSESNCAGCCDSKGVCQLGTNEVSCGAHGAACAVCGPGAVCQAGLCSAASSGGGGGGGGGSGGGGGGSDGGVGDGGSSGGDGGSAPGAFVLDPELRTACNEYIDAFCQREVRCGRMSSQSGCVAHFNLSDLTCLSMFGAAQASIHDGRVSLDQTTLTQCTNELANGACYGDDHPASCSSFLVGHVPEGSACFGGPITATSTNTPGYDCGANGYCDSTATCPGLCRARKPAGAAAVNVAECQAGLILVSGKCANRTPVGQPCDYVATVDPCVSGSMCSDSSHTCVALGGNGGACNTTDYNCQYHLTCDNGTCAPYPMIGQGQSCGSGAAGSCMDDLRCYSETDPYGANGTCVAPHPAGGGCWDFFECQSGLFCIGADTTSSPAKRGTCSSLPGAGSPCVALSGTTPTLCANGNYCDANHICQPYHHVGDHCSTANTLECEPYVSYCDGKTSTCAALKSTGDSCTPSTSQTILTTECQYALYCDLATARCAQRKSAGQSCTYGFECSTASCQSGVCNVLYCYDPTP